MDPSWLTGYVHVSDRLRTVLQVGGRGGGAQRLHVADDLAEQFGLSVDRIEGAGYIVLVALVPHLEAALEEGPGNWINVRDSHRGHRIAEAIVEDLSVQDAVEALEDFGWATARLPGGEVRQLPAQLRALLAERLAERIYKMLAQWRKRDAWHPDRALGIITKRRPA